MTQSFNKLIPAQAERLTLLIEEASEIAHIGCKILRHGYQYGHSKNPFKTNRQILEEKILDFTAVLSLLYATEELKPLVPETIPEQLEEIIYNKAKWFHHQDDIIPQKRN